MEKDKAGVRYKTAKCDCRKTNPPTAILHEGIDPRYFIGHCPRCGKTIVERVYD